MDESSKEVIKENQSISKKLQTKSVNIRKRVHKKAKGQKDIRTLIKPKKNELLTYKKDFELICKQSRIDLDPEQLQIAIALSKSLQDNKFTDNDTTNTEKFLTCKERRNKIRTTLQEYGFKTEKSIPIKKTKRYRRHYKLILLSDTEKQQRITDKYSQLLINNFGIPKTSNESLCKNDNINSYLYNLTTNVPYDYIRGDEIFYIGDLVPKSLDEKYKFKDWSNIPGRPVSPKLEKLKHSFKGTQCSQEELNNILSGPIDIAQDIIRRKNTSDSSITIRAEDSSFTETKVSRESPTEFKLKHGATGIFSEIKSVEDNLISKSFNILSFNDIQTMSLPINRSCSPDLFDDEVTIIMDSPKDKTLHKQEGLTEKTMTVKKQNDFMELTNCIGNYSDSKYIACFSQGINKTRSTSNDFMDLTECIPACSQKSSVVLQSTSSNERVNKNGGITQKNNQIEVVDLNQPPNITNNIKTSIGSNEKLLNDTIIMIDEGSNINTGNKHNVANSSSKNCFVIDLEENKAKNSRIDKSTPKQTGFIVDLGQSPELNNPDNVSHKITPNQYNMNSEENTVSAKDYEYLDTVDLTQPSNIQDCLSTTNIQSVESIVTYEIHTEFVNAIDHSEYPNHNKSKSAIESGNYNGQRSGKCNNLQEMDLTQSSNSEDCLQEVLQHTSVTVRSLDDTITLGNEDFNSIILVNNELKRNDYSSRQDKCYSNNSIFSESIQKAKKDYIPTMFVDIDNDDEFDNLIENISNSKQTNTKLCEMKYQSDCNSFNSYERKNQELDSTEHYDYSSNKLSGQKHVSDKSGNNALDECEINDNSCVIEIEEKCNEIINNTKKCDEKSHTYENFANKILETNTNEKKGIEIDKNEKCYNKHRHIFETIECESKSENIQIENSFHESDYDIHHTDIDLTEKSDSSEDKFCSTNVIEVPGELGKRNNMSVDYDEVWDKANITRGCETTSSFDINKGETLQSGSQNARVFGSSQHSEVFELSDNEFNYSVNQHFQDNESSKETKFDIGGMSVIDEFLNRNSLPKRNTLRCSCNANSESNTNENKAESCLPVVRNNENIASKESKSCEEIKFVKISTPLRSSTVDNIFIAKTPKHDDYLIKTDQVTPMPNYENMTSPERNEELDKFGIKPLKRKRAIKILTHIYNQTHPIMEVISNDECSSPSKIRRKNNGESFPRRAIASQIDAIVASHSAKTSNDTLQILESNLSQKSLKPRYELYKESQKSPNKNSSKENILYEETTLIPDIRDIECSPDDWVFQKREKAKVHSCRVPLHIAFHNYVSSRNALREAILKYEPINIDDIHKGLVAVGYRYNPKDLLKFMDRKCITVKTADNSRRNKNL